MNRKLISFDIDGTLGRQLDSLELSEEQEKFYDREHVVPVKGDRYGSFYFYKGMIKLMQRLNKLNVSMILTTAGFRTPPVGNEIIEDRNLNIQRYVEKVLSKKIPLYGVEYQTFSSLDIQIALKGEIDNEHWQEWFSALFKYLALQKSESSRSFRQEDLKDFKFLSPDDLVTIKDEMPCYSMRDHAVMMERDTETFVNIQNLSDIIHLDDTPSSVLSYKRPNEKVTLIPIP
jgi:hypothetical protein